MSKRIKLDRASTSFQLQLFEHLKTVRADGSKYGFLKYYQNIIRVFMNDVDIDARGLLVKLEMGLGKSICAIAIAMDMLPVRQPIVLLTKSLQQNMRTSIHKYVRLRYAAEPDYALGQLSALDLDAWIDRNFSFVSLNASNMMTQMARAATADIAREFESALERRIGEVLSLPTLDGKLLIVDEAHNLFRAITNGSRNALELYRTVIASTDCRLVFLTGTPIANDPFELVPCFNMLGSRTPGKLTLPEFYRDFYSLYVDREQNRIRNKGKFQNRIFGLVSHVTHTSTPGAAAGITDASTQIEFPEALEPELVRVPMGTRQYAAYLLARDREREETLSRGRVVEAPSMIKPKSSKSSSYRVHSRQLSNYYYDTEAVGAPVPALEAIAPTHTSSPKFETILANVRARPGQLGLVYSQFVSMGGIGIFARFLLSHGYIEYVPKRAAATAVAATAAATTTDITTDLDTHTGGATGASEYLMNIEREAANSEWWHSDAVATYFGEVNGEMDAAAGAAGAADIVDVAASAAASETTGAPKFAVISGRVSPEDRAAIVETFNDPRNAHGGIIDMLLISATGAEGLDLKNVRHIHIMEPYWNYGRIAQVMARGARNDSHKLLPTEEKNVATYIYVAVPPSSETSEHVETTDIELYMESLNDRQLVSSFNMAINEVCIECLLNAEKDCRVCNPTGERLFTDDPLNDVNLPDTCKPRRELSVRVNQILVGDKQYYIADNAGSIYGISVFKLDPEVGAFRRIKESSDEFVAVADAVAAAKK